jgi:hypothetical protein
VGIYNRLQRTALPVERPLVQLKMEVVEAALQRGLAELNWRAEGIDGYIAETLELVKDVDLVLGTVKENVRRTRWAAGRGRQREAAAPVRESCGGLLAGSRESGWPGCLLCRGVARAWGWRRGWRRVARSLARQMPAHRLPRRLPARREVLKVFERNLMFERKEGKVYTFEELGDSFGGRGRLGPRRRAGGPTSALDQLCLQQARAPVPTARS